tara:strand:+ start:928 stop:1146 length:219 start_codon:yes stop_codon:yes gene_type:complete
MPKYKIIITMNKLSGEYVIEGEEWSHKHFESRAEAQEAYHALIMKLTGEVNKVQGTLSAVVHGGHIVEVEDE